MHDMAPEAGICSFADVFAHVCLTMLADPCFLCTREWAAGPSVTASWASHRLPASTTRVPATVFFQGSSSERPTFQKAGGLPVVRGQWCWQCISSSSLEFPSSSRLEDICGQMSRKRWENLFFFFFNWILGPQDEMCQETNGLRNHYPNGLKDFGKRQEDKLRWCHCRFRTHLMTSGSREG